MDLLGKRVKVLWPPEEEGGEGCWYTGTIDTVGSQGWFVRYDDGDEEWIPEVDGVNAVLLENITGELIAEGIESSGVPDLGLDTLDESGLAALPLKWEEQELDASSAAPTSPHDEPGPTSYTLASPMEMRPPFDYADTASEASDSAAGDLQELQIEPQSKAIPSVLEPSQQQQLEVDDCMSSSSLDSCGSSFDEFVSAQNGNASLPISSSALAASLSAGDCIDAVITALGRGSIGGSELHSVAPCQPPQARVNTGAVSALAAGSRCSVEATAFLEGNVSAGTNVDVLLGLHEDCATFVKVSHVEGSSGSAGHANTLMQCKSVIHSTDVMHGHNPAWKKSLFTCELHHGGNIETLTGRVLFALYSRQESDEGRGTSHHFVGQVVVPLQSVLNQVQLVEGERALVARLESAEYQLETRGGAALDKSATLTLALSLTLPLAADIAGEVQTTPKSAMIPAQNGPVQSTPSKAHLPANVQNVHRVPSRRSSLNGRRQSHIEFENARNAARLAVIKRGGGASVRRKSISPAIPTATPRRRQGNAPAALTKVTTPTKSDLLKCVAMLAEEVADMRERVRVLGGRVASTRINVSDASRATTQLRARVRKIIVAKKEMPTVANNNPAPLRASQVTGVLQEMEKFHEVLVAQRRQATDRAASLQAEVETVIAKLDDTLQRIKDAQVRKRAYHPHRPDPAEEDESEIQAFHRMARELRVQIESLKLSKMTGEKPAGKEEEVTCGILTSHLTTRIAHKRKKLEVVRYEHDSIRIEYELQQKQGTRSLLQQSLEGIRHARLILRQRAGAEESLSAHEALVVHRSKREYWDKLKEEEGCGVVS